MAEGESIESRILCRYFVHGVCNKGASCSYSHDRQNQMDNVCKFYLKGCCSFADRCRYDHVKPNKLSKKALAPESVASSKSPRKCIPPPLKDLSAGSSDMVTLKKGVKQKPVSAGLPKSPEQWVQASEFVPGQPYKCSSIPSSYADAASTGSNNDSLTINECSDPSQLLCPFSTNKPCPYGDDCQYIHGKLCDLCGLYVLKPDDEQQNQQHSKECIEQHERDMELSFAVARSKDKQCGVCMDIVMEKEIPSERRFGILSDCTHCFCLACIRKWRASKQFDSKTIRSCPECRMVSDFVTPSQYWVETKEEKIKVIEGYKQALGQKPCKYFSEDRECPFNEKCFYLHLNPDGSKAEAVPRTRRRRQNANGQVDLEETFTFWDFLERRQESLQDLILQLEAFDIAGMLLNINFSDSDDSDSEFGNFFL